MGESFNELVKNYDVIRDYLRDFYVDGFRSKREYVQKRNSKGNRTYDDQIRRIRNWLDEYMSNYRRMETNNEQIPYLEIDSRLARKNPLYRTWKTKSFTDKQILMHFAIMDILKTSGDKGMTVSDIWDVLVDEIPMSDISTVRKTLGKYVEEGILRSEKRGKEVFYFRAAESDLTEEDSELLGFFSETLPCGVIGSYLLDKFDDPEFHLAFKHHYITGALDSEIMYDALQAIQHKQSVTVQYAGEKADKQETIIPLKILSSVQDGRQYLAGWSMDSVHEGITVLRLDRINSIETRDKCEALFDQCQQILTERLPYTWGVSGLSKRGEILEEVEFAIHYDDDETFIPRRLEREKRVGSVKHLDKNTSLFTAKVYDTDEMIPWIRTFISRIEEIHFSNKKVEKRFFDSLNDLYKGYGIEGGADDVLQ